MCYCIMVEQNSKRMIEQCGAFDSIASPGLKFLICCVHTASEPVSMKVDELPVMCETKTKDNVFINIKVSVQFQVVPDDDKIRLAYYELTSPRQQMEAYVYDVVRSEVPKMDLDDVYLEKEKIQTAIAAELKQQFGDFGYQILTSLVTDIEPNQEVKRAMNQINTAKRTRVAAEDEGEAVKIRAIKEAEAEASRTEIQAKADAEAMHMSGVGISRQRQAIMSGLRDSVNAFGKEVEGIHSKQVLDLMIVTQYFDMMSSIGNASKSNAVFLNHSPASLAELSASVNRGFLCSVAPPTMGR
mmetsp:Transcript_29639/g.59587  ORF Transcript_29639/g.59587 Transcript_29639/m.59587 type:complete len:299 (-) Transcript_29639:396-1292(-)|eukprot:CAMPEP_0174717082 /NCGR_PEP_ID=MMETSP1094-20130205/25809_1 /TAXON_ID=156173 /ORGANISM="Chrysochromulina brevifilum, Strain UTEX LB 985" /LENGTH=298 /DNA_ID=CAMNT_0015916971 /DNA_START=58 /DNA_END=954 /DNA_ORIENTATION=-